MDAAVLLKKDGINDIKFIIVGDGSDVFYPLVNEVDNIILSDNKNRYQNAVGVGYAAYELINTGNILSPNELLPVYLRLPQAERELKSKGADVK